MISQGVAKQKIYRQIIRANNILLVSHRQPDADAIGSLSAFGYWLDSLGKKHLKFCEDQPPVNLRWLLNYQPLVTDWQTVVANHFEVIVVLDSGDLQFAGIKDLLPQLTTDLVLINIDHHISNQYFGQLNLVDSKAASTTEIIYQLFKDWQVKISSLMASSLLAGLIYDTYNFTNPNTNRLSLLAAADLLVAGAGLTQVSNAVLKNKTLETLQVWGKALSRLTYNKKFGLATTVISQDDLPANHLAVSEITEGIANLLNNLSGVKAALVLQQQTPDTIKGSLRTNSDLIDVAKLAKILGGGGHRQAAGFKIKGRLVCDQDGYWQII
jgi:phosphoesterase RecJ-like protein